MTGIEVRVPDIGDFSDVNVIEVLIKVGDQVALDDSLITLESDKASMEIPSTAAGVVRSLTVQLGDKLSQGDLICELEAVAKAEEASSSESSTGAAEEPPPSTDKPSSPPSLPDCPPGKPLQPGARYHASPKIRRLAAEYGVPLSQIKGSGANGRITAEDVKKFVSSVINEAESRPVSGSLPATPEVDFSAFGETERTERSRIKKLSGKHLTACWLNVPHVTQFGDADISELEGFRSSMKAQAEERGVRLTLLAFVLKAVVVALREHPHFNASLQGDHLVLKKYFNIGVAVDTAQGLVVPVIHGVDSKGVLDLARELAEISEKARAARLTPTDLSGSCFSISSLGGIGGSYFTPIVNAPEVAILGIGRSSVQPLWDGNAFQPRTVLPLAVSYDHRVVDGVQGARFMVSLCQLLSDIRQLIL